MHDFALVTVNAAELDSLPDASTGIAVLSFASEVVVRRRSHGWMER
jgi:hypothetical protein